MPPIAKLSLKHPADTPIQNVSPALWASLSPVRLTHNKNHYHRVLETPTTGSGISKPLVNVTVVIMITPCFHTEVFYYEGVVAKTLDQGVRRRCFTSCFAMLKPPVLTQPLSISGLSLLFYQIAVVASDPATAHR